jgi:OOP family OmpA-OmpF porin
MRNPKKKQLLTASLVLLGASGTLMAQSMPVNYGYWVDSSGRVAKNSWGECWRSGYWMPALAIAECDPDLVPKPAPVPVAAPAPAPVAAPAPVVAPPPPPPPPAAPAFRTVITEKPVVLEGANFPTGSSTLLPSAYGQLNQVAQQSKDHPDINFEVSGYTDNVGSAQSNVRLSQARAESVKAYLVSRGVAASRISTKGYGEESPIADNNTFDGRAQNRRVEIRYTDKVESRVRVAP